MRVAEYAPYPPPHPPPLAWPTESPKHQGTTSGLLWPVSYIEENGLSRGSFAPEAAALLERTNKMCFLFCFEKKFFASTRK